MSSALINVKSTQAFTLEFLGNTANPCYSKGLLESSPSIYFSGNSLFFNYSQTKNSNDLRFLKLFFDGLSVGNTFNFSGGVYVDIDTGAQTTWSGQLTLQGKTGTFNEYLYFSGVSGTSNLTQNNYDYKLFTSPIQFTGTSKTTVNLLLLKNPGPDPLNFSYLGLYGSDLNIEEYIEVDTSALNNYRIPVQTSIKLNDGSEAILLDAGSPIVDENLFFQKSMVYVYLRGTLTPDEINFDETINGVLRITADSPGVFSLTLDNQNFQQSILTKYDPAPETLYYYWYPNSTLSNFAINNKLPYTTESHSYAAIYHLIYTTVTQTVYTSSALNDIPIIATTETYNTIAVDGNSVQTLIFTATTAAENKNFKIDLSDARNLGTDIKVFLDADCSVPLEQNSKLIGVPGRDGAAFIYYADRTDSIQSIYMKLTRENTKVLEIIID